MKVLCLIKFTPDVDSFVYDYENNVLVRENVKLVLNPDDSCALAYILKLKERIKDIEVEVVTMAPLSVMSLVEDLLRRGVDRATIISDKAFVGSDTFVTSTILAEYIKKQQFTCIFSGTHSLDGDTAHIPSQVAESLGINNMCNIIKIESELTENSVKAKVDFEDEICTFDIGLPAVLGIKRESKYKLPYVKYKNIDLYVKDRIEIITNDELMISKEKVGIEGSLTKVMKTYVKEFNNKENIYVKNDDEGIEVVYQFLKEKGFV